MHLSHLGTCHNNDEAEMAVRERLEMQQPYVYCNETHAAKAGEMLPACLGIMLRNNDMSV